MAVWSEEVKILRPFTGTGAIFFPIGKPPDGTCEFATSSCIKSCYAALPDWPDFDEQIRIPEDEKREIYKIFVEAPVWWLVKEIMHELDGLQTHILHWFGSGDCQTKDTQRIIEIIEKVGSQCGWTEYTQMGFTRNVNLWEAKKDIFALTVETAEEIAGRDGMFSVPDYLNGTNKMYFNNLPTRGGLCGPELCHDRVEESLTHFIDCQICRRLKMGCFDRCN